MEKCVDSYYLQPKGKAPEAPKKGTGNGDFYCTIDAEEKSKCKDCCKVSRADKEIALQGQSSDPPNTLFNGTRDRTRRHQSGTKVNVLKKNETEITTQSVQKKTKIKKCNVPDRLGKHVSYTVRCETKLSSNEGDNSAKKSTTLPPTSKEVSVTVGVVERKYEGDGCVETKLAVLENECLSKKEADRLRNSFESDLETKNIFENFFDDCLDSTSRKKGMSSQDLHSKKRADEKTPEKTRAESFPIGAPIKIRDHSSYYSSPKSIRHVCEYCHKIFKSNGKLNSHVYSHTGERPFDCSHCGKGFSSKFKLVRHLLIHSEIRKFVCQICDRTFLRNDHLKNHYKVHDPQKKMYKCPKENCDKEYSSLMSHKKHMAYHSVEDGDLKCLICNVKYETKEEILFHLKSHSGSRLFKTQSDKKFKCEFCDRLFLTRKDVTRHLVVHTGERDFLCQFCPQRFGRKDHLVRHIKKSHGNEDLVGNENSKTTKEDRKKQEDAKPHGKPYKRTAAPRNFEPRVSVKETKMTGCTNDTSETCQSDSQTEDNKTHILITVQGKAFQNRKKQKLHKKPFQKNEMLVPKKKQVPLSKNKSQTTQILLQNIPNILIIPNNSIILLRNQVSAKKNAGDLSSPSPSPSAPPEPHFDVPLPSAPSAPAQTPNPCTTNDFINFNYDPHVFPSPSELLAELSEADTFSSFHPDLPPFPAHFDEPDFIIPGHCDLLPDDTQFPDAPRPPPNPTPSKNKAPFDAVDSGDGLLLNEAILGDFKEDGGTVVPPSEGDPGNGGFLGNILGQGNDNCGFELLRHLLTTENPVLSPLPGFSQIFHNSNVNPN